MNPRLTVWEAAQRLVITPDDEIHTRAIADALVTATAQGSIAGEKAAAFVMPVMFAIGESAMRAPAAVPEKTYCYASKIDFAQACIWYAAQGRKVPERALELLSADLSAQLVRTRTPSAFAEREKKKELRLAGELLRFIQPHLPPKFSHGGAANKKALAAALIEQVQDENGDTPHGWERASLEKLLSDAEKAAAPGAARCAIQTRQIGNEVIQLDGSAGRVVDNA